MKFTQSLKSLSLDSLLQLLVAGTQNLLESKRDYTAHDMTLIYQRLLDRIQCAIGIKQGELPLK